MHSGMRGGVKFKIKNLECRMEKGKREKKGFEVSRCQGVEG